MIRNTDGRKIYLTQSIARLTDGQNEAYFTRGSSSGDSVSLATARIVEEVRSAGDAALSGVARRFDCTGLKSIGATGETSEDALN